tara:strand:- start:587 stop:1339 length:753 start_codon:yes stop_codon:yes gene_type:complete
MLLFISISFLFGIEQSFRDGVSAYNYRAENSSGLSAQPDQINKAINAFNEAKKNPNHEIEASIYLLRCYYFKGKFVSQSDDEKKNIFNLGKVLGENLIEKYPESVAARYWYLVNLGSWSEVYGLFAAAKEGVADLMKEHSEKIIEMDLKYSDGGGYFLLGAVHLKSPYIPFVLSWPSNDKAVDYLTDAFEIGKSTPAQTVYLARALYKDGQKDKAKQLLSNLITKPLSDDQPVEDYEQQVEAKGFLAEWK